MSTQIQCRQCSTAKPAEEFYVSNQTRCKACVKLYSTAWRLVNADRKRETNRTWAKNNREVNRLSANSFYRENHEYCLERDRLRNAREKARDEIAFLERGRAQHKRIAEALSNAYVANIMGMRVSDVSASLILSKREQLQVFRMARELKTAVKKES